MFYLFTKTFALQQSTLFHIISIKKKNTQTNLIKGTSKVRNEILQKKKIGFILGDLGLKICVKGTAKYKR